MESPTPKLDSLSQRFLAELERLVPRDGFRTEFTDGCVVTIPARDAEVGDITIWLDGEVNAERPSLTKLSDSRRRAPVERAGATAKSPATRKRKARWLFAAAL